MRLGRRRTGPDIRRGGRCAQSAYFKPKPRAAKTAPAPGAGGPPGSPPAAPRPCSSAVHALSGADTAALGLHLMPQIRNRPRDPGPVMEEAGGASDPEAAASAAASAAAGSGTAPARRRRARRLPPPP